LGAGDESEAPSRRAGPIRAQPSGRREATFPSGLPRCQFRRRCLGPRTTHKTIQIEPAEERPKEVLDRTRKARLQAAWAAALVNLNPLPPPGHNDHPKAGGTTSNASHHAPADPAATHPQRRLLQPSSGARRTSPSRVRRAGGGRTVLSAAGLDLDIHHRARLARWRMSWILPESRGMIGRRDGPPPAERHLAGDPSE
jgi:hypothetical protein